MTKEEMERERVTHNEVVRFMCEERYDKGRADGRAEAIDEFLRKLYPCRYEYNDECFLCGSFAHCMVFTASLIADKMKEGKE